MPSSKTNSAKTRILSEREFREKHAAKFVNLSKAEINRRYAQYLRTERAAEANVRIRELKPRHARPKDFVDQAKREAHRIATENAFFARLADPLAFKDAAPSPALAMCPTVESQLRWQVPVYTNSLGEAAIFMRPSFEGGWAVTNVVDNIATTSVPADADVVFNAIAANASSGTANAPFTSSGYAVQTWRDAPEAKAIRNLFTDYVPTACGFEFRYTNELLGTKGKAAIARIPGAYGAPHMLNSMFTLNPDVGEPIKLPSSSGLGSTVVGYQADRLGSNGMETGNITYANLAQMMHSDTTAMQEHMGFQAVWAPQSPEVFSKLRPTKYAPIGVPAALASVADTYAPPNGAGNPFWVLPPVCATDPETFKAFHDGMARNSAFVSSDNQAAVADLNYQNTGVLSLYGDVMTSGTTSAVCAQNNAAIAAGAQQHMGVFQACSMDDADTTLVAVLDGLPASQEVGYVEFVLNISAIPELRSFKPGFSAEHKPRNPKIAEVAHMIHNVPESLLHPPAKDPMHNSSVADSIVAGVNKVASVAEQVVAGANTAQAIVGEVWPVVEEIGGVLASIFL